MGIPLLKGTLVAEGGRSIGIYIPISRKDFAASVRKSLLAKMIIAPMIIFACRKIIFRNRKTGEGKFPIN